MRHSWKSVFVRHFSRCARITNDFLSPINTSHEHMSYSPALRMMLYNGRYWIESACIARVCVCVRCVRQRRKCMHRYVLCIMVIETANLKFKTEVEATRTARFRCLHSSHRQHRFVCGWCMSEQSTRANRRRWFEAGGMIKVDRKCSPNVSVCVCSRIQPECGSYF